MCYWRVPLLLALAEYVFYNHNSGIDQHTNSNNYPT